MLKIAKNVGKMSTHVILKVVITFLKDNLTRYIKILKNANPLTKQLNFKQFFLGNNTWKTSFNNVNTM